LKSFTQIDTHLDLRKALGIPKWDEAVDEVMIVKKSGNFLKIKINIKSQRIFFDKTRNSTKNYLSWFAYLPVKHFEQFCLSKFEKNPSDISIWANEWLNWNWEKIKKTVGGPKLIFYDQK
jgi:hypothetical protein